MGMIFLVGGSASDLLAPLYIGLVITALQENDMDKVRHLCLQLFVIVCVSKFHFYSLGRRSLCWTESINIQHNER